MEPKSLFVFQNRLLEPVAATIPFGQEKMQLGEVHPGTLHNVQLLESLVDHFQPQAQFTKKQAQHQVMPLFQQRGAEKGQQSRRVFGFHIEIFQTGEENTLIQVVIPLLPDFSGVLDALLLAVGIAERDPGRYEIGRPA